MPGFLYVRCNIEQCRSSYSYSFFLDFVTVAFYVTYQHEEAHFLWSGRNVGVWNFFFCLYQHCASWNWKFCTSIFSKTSLNSSYYHILIIYLATWMDFNCTAVQIWCASSLAEIIKVTERTIYLFLSLSQLCIILCWSDMSQNVRKRGMNTFQGTEHAIWSEISACFLSLISWGTSCWIQVEKWNILSPAGRIFWFLIWFSLNAPLWCLHNLTRLDFSSLHIHTTTPHRGFYSVWQFAVKLSVSIHPFRNLPIGGIQRWCCSLLYETLRTIGGPKAVPDSKHWHEGIHSGEEIKRPLSLNCSLRF